MTNPQIAFMKRVAIQPTRVTWYEWEDVRPLADKGLIRVESKKVRRSNEWICHMTDKGRQALESVL